MLISPKNEKVPANTETCQERKTRSRTRDLQLGKLSLYQLSYFRVTFTN